MSHSSRVYLAADLGASSGRLVAGRYDGAGLELEEVHRFGNGPVAVGDRMYWDFYRQWSEVQAGLCSAVDRYGAAVRSVGVDTWGVDFGLAGPGDELLGGPRHYRDPRTRGALERAFAEVSRSDIFQATGLQFMELNTLYQLLAIRDQAPGLLDVARRFMMMPDLFHWHLTGTMTNEITNASTTQFLDPRTGTWCRELLERFQVPTHYLRDLIQPGTQIGSVRPAVAEATGLASDVTVVAPGSHDTASAVLSVPSASAFGTDPDWCYISSGTWSLMGVEVPSAVVTPLCEELNFTNEGGIGGTYRLLRNIAGLWLVQECRRIWAAEGHAYSWEELAGLAQLAPPLARIINPDDTSLIAPRHMPDAIAALCVASGQTAPSSHGEVIRCALESLSMRYRIVLDWLEQLLQHRIETVHVVGGGTCNEALCQMTADACDRKVVAGPVEATAIGNLAIQALADGVVSSVTEVRDLIRRSFPTREYSPQHTPAWQDACARHAHRFAKDR